MDLYEFGIDDSASIAEVLKTTDDHRTKGVGSKPMMVFLGPEWESDTTYSRIQNIFIDLFRGAKVEKLSLKALDHVISFTASEGKIFVRAYSVRLKKSGQKIPNVELANMGPFWDLTVRRTQLASDDLWKTALRQPKTSNDPKNVKNIASNSVGDRVGKIHMEKQDIDNMKVRKMNVLRERNPDAKSNKSEADNGGDSSSDSASEEFSEDEDDIAVKKNLKKIKGSL